MNEELFKECHDELNKAEYLISVQERNYITKSSEIFLSVTPGLGIISLCSNLFVIILILIAIKKRRIPNRKYTVILSRHFGDVLTSLVIIIFSIVANIENVYFAMAILCLFVSTFGVVQCSLSHILIITIRQLSHDRIALYNEIMQPRRVFASTIFLWLGSLFYSATFAPLFAAVFDPVNASNVCQFESCQSPLVIIAIVLIAFLLLFCLIFYLTVFRRLFSSIKEERSRNELPISKYRLKKFITYGGHIALYALIVSLKFIGLIFIYRAMSDINNLLYPIHQCKIPKYLSTVNRLQILSGGIILLWIVRMVFDPIILCATEYRRIMPWINNSSDIHQLEEVQLTFSSSQPCESLKWRRHCPIMEMERTISAWDMKN
uniref:G-protein coupled receptors family 1 profile domain-containing protein n=1 Tax=Panagrolaimus sp. PS1159 TaxID=55785 RepID=A0AC35FKM0_9BILA